MPKGGGVRSPGEGSESLTNEVRPNEEVELRALSGAIHDLSNALTIIEGLAAESSEWTESKVREAMRRIALRAGVARQVAREALRPTRESPLEWPLPSLVQDVVTLLEVEASRRKLDLVVVGEGPTGRVDHARELWGVLENVLLNALAHSPPGSTIHLSYGMVTPNCCSIHVQDDGPGITKGSEEDIFGGASSRPGGLGVGLRHSRTVSRRMGGGLELLPATRGAGFEIRWPARHGEVDESHVDLRKAHASSLRLLVLEDDEDLITLLEVALPRRGYLPTVVRTEQALRVLVAKAGWDVVILDLSPLAGSSLQALLADFLRLAPSLRIVVATGEVTLNEGDEVALQNAGARVLSKPYEIRDLLEVVDEIIAHPEVGS